MRCSGWRRSPKDANTCPSRSGSRVIGRGDGCVCGSVCADFTFITWTSQATHRSPVPVHALDLYHTRCWAQQSRWVQQTPWSTRRGDDDDDKYSECRNVRRGQHQGNGEPLYLNHRSGRNCAAYEGTYNSSLQTGGTSSKQPRQRFLVF